MWCVETVKSSTTGTLSTSFSSPSQVSPRRHAERMQEACSGIDVSLCGLFVLLATRENKITSVQSHMTHFLPCWVTLYMAFASCLHLLRHHCGFLCFCQWLLGVHCLVIMSTSFTRFDSTGGKKTREDQSTPSTSRLSLWRYTGQATHPAPRKTLCVYTSGSDIDPYTHNIGAAWAQTSNSSDILRLSFIWNTEKEGSPDFLFHISNPFATHKAHRHRPILLM